MKNMRSWAEQTSYFLGSVKQLEQYNRINLLTEEAADSAVLSLSLMVFSAVSDWKYLAEKVGNFIAAVLGVNYWSTRVQLFLSWETADKIQRMGFKEWARMVQIGRVKNRFIDHHSSKKFWLKLI